METWIEIIDAERQIDQALSTLRTNGVAYASSEREYRIAKAKKILELKSKGVPATLILDLAKGDEDVSLLAMKRDIADVNYKANKDAIMVKMQELSILKVQYEKEYTATK